MWVDGKAGFWKSCGKSDGEDQDFGNLVENLTGKARILEILWKI
jgi:hypothetical protein